MTSRWRPLTSCGSGRSLACYQTEPPSCSAGEQVWEEPWLDCPSQRHNPVHVGRSSVSRRKAEAGKWLYCRRRDTPAARRAAPPRRPSRSPAARSSRVCSRTRHKSKKKEERDRSDEWLRPGDKREMRWPADEEVTLFTAHLPCNLITDERPSPPEHRQVLLLLWQGGMSAAPVSVLHLSILLQNEKDRFTVIKNRQRLKQASECVCPHFVTVAARVCFWGDSLLLCFVCCR